MRTHSYCLGCKYSLQMYLRSSSSSSTVGCGCNSVLLATCAGDKQSSQSRFPVIPDILPDVCASVVIPRCSPCVCSDRRLLRRLPARTRHCSAITTRFPDLVSVTLISPLPPCETTAGSNTNNTDYCSEQELLEEVGQTEGGGLDGWGQPE